MGVKRLAAPILVILALAALALWGVWQRAPREAVQTIACADPVAGCAFVHNGGPAILRFSVQPRALEPFVLTLAAPNLRAAAVSFGMAGMDMGFNRYELRQGETGRWAASVTLPVCTASRVDWIAELDLDGRLYNLVFTTH